jgi:hypothetical protein
MKKYKLLICIIDKTDYLSIMNKVNNDKKMFKKIIFWSTVSFFAGIGVAGALMF